MHLVLAAKLSTICNSFPGRTGFGVITKSWRSAEAGLCEGQGGAVGKSAALVTAETSGLRESWEEVENRYDVVKSECPKRGQNMLAVWVQFSFIGTSSTLEMQDQEMTKDGNRNGVETAWERSCVCFREQVP